MAPRKTPRGNYRGSLNDALGLIRRCRAVLLAESDALAKLRLQRARLQGVSVLVRLEAARNLVAAEAQREAAGTLVKGQKAAAKERQHWASGLSRPTPPSSVLPY